MTAASSAKNESSNSPVLTLFQQIVSRWNPRGLPRLAWQMRHVMLGRGLQAVWYQRRFQFLCDCESHYGVLQAYGFIHRAMDQVLQKLTMGDTCEVQFFDIGANAGFVSLLACSLAPHRVRAHCFEPNPMAAQRLHGHAVMNPFRMAINEYALGDAAGKLTMTLGAESSNSTLVPGGFAEAGGVGTTEVEVKTLDEYCAEYGVTPTIAKLDVEGFEPHVLRGSTRTLMMKRPILMVEVNAKALMADGSSAIELLEQIERFGYRTYLIDPRQVEMTADVRQVRSQWRGYPEAKREDFKVSRLCDVLAIPT